MTNPFLSQRKYACYWSITTIVLCTSNLPPPPPPTTAVLSNSTEHLKKNCPAIMFGRDGATRIDDRHFRNKIVVISAILASGIVFLHLKFDKATTGLLLEIHEFFTFMEHTCVPLFFAISGYLFFRGFRFDQVKAKLLRRAKNLLVPYIVWNVLYVAFMTIMFKFGLINELGFSPDTYGTLKAVLNAECSPLWFVRYLMLFVCIAPLAYFVLRYRLLGGLMIIAMLAFNLYNYQVGHFSQGINVNANTLVMFNYQFVYFATGAYAALCWSDHVERMNKWVAIIAIVTLVVMIIGYQLYLRTEGTTVSNHLFRWLWIPVFWFSYDLLPEIKVRPWMKYSFFLYCSHMFIVYCAQGIAETTYASMDDWRPILSYAEYIVIGIFTIWILVTLAGIIKNRFPKAHLVLSGARG